MCDPEVIGRTLNGPSNVKITVKPAFYGDQEIDVEDLKDELRGAVSINAIGKKSV